eukprot:CAMPEP_0184380138 /NCGR_PEP_ID=MMETSP0007-20130409/4481_1 /TAXON_ID=97485 /ORGANISM="Prymnesium parvum, Strain Texoma1" /LENGTH=39 /DNA_ID= /DNA_START= /DNA_END= /DNA_ORIENTATION=
MNAPSEKAPTTPKLSTATNAAVELLSSVSVALVEEVMRT